METKQCICDRKAECTRISTFFSGMGDPRGKYSEVPPLVQDVQTSSQELSNKYREALLGAIIPEYYHSLPQDGCVVANHHFHPRIVKRFPTKIPMCLSEKDMILLRVKPSGVADMVMDEHGKPTGDFFVVPNYSFRKTKKSVRKYAKAMENGDDMSSVGHDSFSSIHSRDMFQDLMASYESLNYAVESGESVDEQSKTSSLADIPSRSSLRTIHTDDEEKRILSGKGYAKNSFGQSLEPIIEKEVKNSSEHVTEPDPISPDEAEDASNAVSKTDAAVESSLYDPSTAKNVTPKEMDPDRVGKSNTKGAGKSDPPINEAISEETAFETTTESTKCHPADSMEEIAKSAETKAGQVETTEAAAEQSDSVEKGSQPIQQLSEVAGTVVLDKKDGEGPNLGLVVNDSSKTRENVGRDGTSTGKSDKSVVQTVPASKRIRSVGLTREDLVLEDESPSVDKSSGEIHKKQDTEHGIAVDDKNLEGENAKAATNAIENYDVGRCDDLPDDQISEVSNMKEEEAGEAEEKAVLCLQPLSQRKVIATEMGTDHILRDDESDSGSIDDFLMGTDNTDVPLPWRQDDPKITSLDVEQILSDLEKNPLEFLVAAEDPNHDRKSMNDKALSRNAKYGQKCTTNLEMRSATVRSEELISEGSTPDPKWEPTFMQTNVDDMKNDRSFLETKELSIQSDKQAVENSSNDANVAVEGTARVKEAFKLPDEAEAESNNELKKSKSDHKVVFIPSLSSLGTLDKKRDVRDEEHARMVEFESKRRSTHSLTITSIRMRWQSCLSLMNDGIEEIRQAERLFVGCRLAFQAYTTAMDAICNDVFLDDRGNRVTNARKQEQLFRRRSGLDCSVLEAIDLDGDIPDREEDELSPPNLTTGHLNSVIDSQSTIATLLSESSGDIANNDEIAVLKKDVEKKKARLEKLGNAIVERLAQEESRVLNAWDTFDRVAAKILCREHAEIARSSGHSEESAIPKPAPPTTPVRDSTRLKTTVPKSPDSVAILPLENMLGTETDPPRRSTSKQRIMESPASPTVEKKKDPVHNSTDMWLAEMQYRVAVVFQMQSWEQIDIDSFFGSVVEMERDRQTKLHELLLRFVPRQRRLFSSCSQATTIAALGSATQEAIVTSIEQNVEGHAYELMLSDGETRSWKPLKTLNEDLATESLLSPLGSKLVCSATVMERKGWGGWKPVLAVVTADCFLNVFDISKKYQSPGEAFAELVPILNGDLEAKTNSTRKILKKMVSFYLPQCRTSFGETAPRQLEIAQFATTRKKALKRIILQNESVQATQAWMNSWLASEMVRSKSWDEIELTDIPNDPVEKVLGHQESFYLEDTMSFASIDPTSLIY